MASPIPDLQDALDRQFQVKSNVIILEAGCGSGSRIRLPENSRIVGIDISQEELDKNTVVHEKIVGDVQTHEFPADSFDLIVCWDVLEHLPEPGLALDLFAKSLKPGGVMLLAFPNVYSIKALVAKFTPHWFHVFVYKRIYGSQYGSPGLITFPTYLRRAIAPKAIREYASAKGLSIEFERIYESSVQQRARNKYKITKWRYNVFKFLSELATLNTHRLDESDCIFMLKRPEASHST